MTIICSHGGKSMVSFWIHIGMSLTSCGWLWSTGLIQFLWSGLGLLSWSFPYLGPNRVILKAFSWFWQLLSFQDSVKNPCEHQHYAQIRLYSFKMIPQWFPFTLDSRGADITNFFPGQVAFALFPSNSTKALPLSTTLELTICTEQTSPLGSTLALLHCWAFTIASFHVWI